MTAERSVHDPAALPATEELTALVRQVLREAQADGAGAAAAAVSFGVGLSLTVRLDEVESLEFNRDRSLAVTVYFGRRKGSASTSDWRPAAVRDAVRAAGRIARLAEEDDCAGLADAERMAQAPPDLDLYHPWALSPEDAENLARRAEAAGRAPAQISNSRGASAASYERVQAYGNTHGFAAGYRASRHSISCGVVAGAGERMQRDGWYTVARAAQDLESAEAVGRRAAERALRRLDARPLKTCTAPVLFAPEVAKGLLGHFIAAIQGGRLYRRTSFLQDSLGERVFAPCVQLYERPLLPKGLGSAPFDSEGVATADRDLVRDGVLQGYVLGSYSARKLGMSSTANAGGVHNVIIAPGPDDQTALIGGLSRGLVVTELMGQGINYVTGDYSRGAAGFWVEQGEIQHPVEEITIAGNLRDMFARLVAVGNDVDSRGSVHTGSILIEEMTIAGQ